MRWVALESVIQSEVSQNEKNKHRMLMHRCGTQVSFASGKDHRSSGSSTGRPRLGLQGPPGPRPLAQGLGIFTCPSLRSQGCCVVLSPRRGHWQPGTGPAHQAGRGALGSVPGRNSADSTLCALSDKHTSIMQSLGTHTQDTKHTRPEIPAGVRSRQLFLSPQTWRALLLG